MNEAQRQRILMELDRAKEQIEADEDGEGVARAVCGVMSTVQYALMAGRVGQLVDVMRAYIALEREWLAERDDG